MSAPPPPFRVHEPRTPGPVVVEVPHAGLFVDEISARFTRAPERALAADADLAADALFGDVGLAGAALVVATPSRFVIDLNTAPRVPTPYEDKLPPGLREVRRRSVSGEQWLESRPPRAEIERRIRGVFEPYHAEIAARLAALRGRHGVAILVSGHAYPDVRFPGAADVVHLREYGYRVFMQSDAERLAQMRAQSIGCREVTLRASGGALGPRAGYRFYAGLVVACELYPAHVESTQARYGIPTAAARAALDAFWAGRIAADPALAEHWRELCAAARKYFLQGR